MIDGLKTYKRKKVVLDEFFSTPTFVEVRPLTSYARQQVIDKLTQGRKSYLNKKGEVDSTDIGVDASASHESWLIKLINGVVSHNIMRDGQVAKWDETLWRELEEADPAILEKVVNEINDLTYPPEAKTAKNESEKDPT